MSVDAILASLSAITNEWRAVAMAWHVVFAVLVVAIASRAIGRGAAAFVLAVAALSVAALAAWSGNPVNAGVFLVAGGIMLRFAATMGAASKDGAGAMPASFTDSGAPGMALFLRRGP
jgi:hypothetical protein